MALKEDRQVDAVDISFFLNETASKGVTLVTSTAGSGVSMDNPASLATVAANSSGNQPLGCLLNDFVNVDQTRTPINWHKDEAQIGTKATILTKGWVVTNAVTGTPTAGNKAVLASSGYVMPRPAITSWNQVANPLVGQFRSKVDQYGYAKVYFDL